MPPLPGCELIFCIMTIRADLLQITLNRAPRDIIVSSCVFLHHIAVRSLSPVCVIVQDNIMQMTMMKSVARRSALQQQLPWPRILIFLHLCKGYSTRLPSRMAVVGPQHNQLMFVDAS